MVPTPPFLRRIAGLNHAPPERRFTLALLAFLVVAAGFLVVTGKEWRDALPSRLERIDARFEQSGRSFASENDRQRVRLKLVPVPELARTCLWWATAANVGLAGALLLARKWWLRPMLPSRRQTASPLTVSRKRFFAALCLVLAGATVLRLPRMNQSLYNDEAFNLTRYIDGQFKPDPADVDAEPDFERVPWTETLWGNQQGNNGVLYSLSARACHSLWSSITGAREGEFREWTLRLPALVPGVLSIAVLSLLAARMGGTSAGLVVAVVAAAHPWHLRYSTDGRPYGLVLLGVALAVYALERGLEDGRWRWWLLYGFALVVTLGSFAGALHFALGLNAAVFLFLVYRALRAGRGEKAAAVTLLGRLVVANVLAAMLYLQLLSPILPQMKPAIASMLGDDSGGSAVLAIVPDVFSYLLTGMPWFDGNPANPLNPAMVRLFAPPYFWIALLFAVGVLIALGLRALFRASPTGGIAVCGSLVALASALASSALSGIALHRWYLIHALPAVLLLLGFGMHALFRLATVSRARIWLLSVPAIWLASVCYPIRGSLSQGKEDLRGITLKVRSGLAPFNPDQRRILFGSFWSDPVYCPDLVHTPGPGDVRALMDLARAEDRPLYIEFGHRDLAREYNPETVALLEESGAFVLENTFEGLEEAQFTHYLFRLVGEDSPSDSPAVEMPN